jgi:hypothetical protein
MPCQALNHHPFLAEKHIADKAHLQIAGFDDEGKPVKTGLRVSWNDELACTCDWARLDQV